MVLSSAMGHSRVADWSSWLNWEGESQVDCTLYVTLPYMLLPREVELAPLLTKQRAKARAATSSPSNSASRGPVKLPSVMLAARR